MLNLRNALFILNCHYGRGDIASIDVRNRIVKTRASAGGEWTFRYRIEKREDLAVILHYRGHRRMIGAPLKRSRVQ